MTSYFLLNYFCSRSADKEVSMKDLNSDVVPYDLVITLRDHTMYIRLAIAVAIGMIKILGQQ